MDSDDPSERLEGAQGTPHKAAIATFGMHAERATRLRELGDLLDDLVSAVRHRDPRTDGLARKLAASWRELDDRLLFFPLEIRADGHLVLAAESTRARFVLPAFQAGLRALTLEQDTQPEDVLAFARALALLEQGSLSQRELHDWLWSGNPEGLSVLLGHPVHDAAINVVEDPISSSELWNAHASAAIEEWNSLAQEAAQSFDAATIASRYRGPVERLAKRMASKDLLLDRGELSLLSTALRDPEQETHASLWLLSQRPELSRWLTPREAASVMRLGLSQGTPTDVLLACIDAMSSAVARSALAACPELLLAQPARLFAPDGSLEDKQKKALLAQRGAGAFCLHRLVLEREGAGLSRAELRAFYEAVGEAGLYEVLHDGWKSRQLDLVRLLSLEMLARDPRELEAALAKHPPSPSDDPEIAELLVELRSLPA